MGDTSENKSKHGNPHLLLVLGSFRFDIRANFASLNEPLLAGAIVESIVPRKKTKRAN